MGGVAADEPADDTQGRKRLGELVKQRRLAIPLSVRAAADLAKIARGTWDSLEDGSRRTLNTAYAGIERALQWAPGSVEAILRGGEPTLSSAIRVDYPTGDGEAFKVDVIPAIPPDTDDPMLRPLLKILRNKDLTDEQKARIIRTLIAEQEQFARARADELIRDAQQSGPRAQS